jgi:hypothetical protein
MRQSSVNSTGLAGPELGVTPFIYEYQKPRHVGKWVKGLRARSLATAVLTSMAKRRRGNDSCQDILCGDTFFFC